MNILAQIEAHKKTEVASRQQIVSFSDLQKRSVDHPKISLTRALISSSTGIIAEFKRKSPSKNWIAKDAEIARVLPMYVNEGASGLSILTDTQYFGGSFDDFKAARKLIPHIPLLQKDFIVSTYQIQEAYLMGANVVLLIAAILSVQQCQEFAHFAHSLGLETILEIHSEEELDRYNVDIDIVGINNRNLKTFEVDIQASIQLASLLPKGVLHISESGLDSANTIKQLRSKGFQGFLMGEAFMKTNDQGKALFEIINQL